MGRNRSAYRVLVGEPEVERPLVRPRRRWEDVLNWILKKQDGGMDWIHLAESQALLNRVMNLWVPLLEWLSSCCLLNKDSMELVA
jgi:hypothetical protein